MFYICSTRALMWNHQSVCTPPWPLFFSGKNSLGGVDVGHLFKNSDCHSVRINIMNIFLLDRHNSMINIMIVFLSCNVCVCTIIKWVFLDACTHNGARSPNIFPFSLSCMTIPLVFSFISYHYHLIACHACHVYHIISILCPPTYHFIP